MGIDVTPTGSRGTRSPRLLNRLLAPFMKLQIAKYRRNQGPEQPHMMGFPALILTTLGARSGQLRTVPLGGFPDGERAWLVVASVGGAARHPAWFLNMARHPDQIWVEVGPHKYRVEAQSLRGEQREAALRRISSIAPRYGEYQKKTDREIPIIRLSVQD